jgi:membrane protease YdiL (CAAX protease family)
MKKGKKDADSLPVRKSLVPEDTSIDAIPAGEEGAEVDSAGSASSEESTGRAESEKYAEFAGSADTSEKDTPARIPFAEIPFGERFPTTVDMLSVVGVLAISLLLSGVLFWGLSKTDMDYGLIVMLCYALQFLPVILFIPFLRKRRGAPCRALKPLIRGMNAPLVLWGILLVFAASVVIEPLLELFPAESLEKLYGTLGRGGWTIAMTVVLAPVLEEVLFRHQILGALKEKYGSVVALLGSALFFGLLHIVAPAQAVNAFVVGIILGYIYMASGSLLTVILIHAVNNAIAYLGLELFGDSAASMTMRSIMGNDTLYYIFYGVCLSLFVLGCVGVWRTLRKSRLSEMAAPADDCVPEDGVD